MKPLCFVIMPFGKKKDAANNEIDFDYVYNNFIRVVIEKAGLMPIIHKPMYERLILCDYAIADLTTANANVFYELGVRYTAKPFTTFSIFETGTKIPFDLADVRCFPYTLQDGKVQDIDSKIDNLLQYINGIKADKKTDSPIYQLLDGVDFRHNLSHEKVALMRTQTDMSETVRQQLYDIIHSDASDDDKATAITDLEHSLGDKNDWQAGLCVDVLLAYRSVKGFDAMVTYILSLPPHLQKTVMIQEQLGFALNRTGKKDRAIAVLNKVIAENGLSSETCGILGRVYKDRYDESKDNPGLAAEYLNLAIDTYMAGYKADMRNFYPGVNAATLMHIRKDPATSDFVTIVEFSVHTHIEKKSKSSLRGFGNSIDDYWPFATLLELSVIQGDEAKAHINLNKCLIIQSEKWQRETTANNLTLLAGQTDWVKNIAAILLKKENNTL
jgi:hypothetical protein